MTADTTSLDDALRPEAWDDFVGQHALKAELETAIVGAVTEDRPLGHVLLYGPPGVGKTSMARLIADRLRDPMVSLTMPIDQSALVRELRHFEGGVLLLDEIHNATTAQQNKLLPLLEPGGGFYMLPSGQRLHVPWLTVIGATTEPQKLIPPLYDRFMHIPDYDEYTDAELADIVLQLARRADVKIARKEAETLGVATGGIPRTALRFVLAARDLAARHGKPATAEQVLALKRIDHDGLTEQHRRYITALEQMGGTAGLGTLSTMLRLHEAVVRDLERLVVRLRLITYTRSGRELTPAGWERAGHGKRRVRRAS